VTDTDPGKRKARGTLPKAYLRIDPNLDQTHPDCGAFVRLLCAGARQPVRGRFKTWDVLVNAVGRRAAMKHRDVWRDVHPAGEALVIDGWDIWQEGDFTVGERMRLYRDKLRNKRVTDPPGNRNAPSEALGSKASGTDAADPPDTSQDHTDSQGESPPAIETTGDAREAQAKRILEHQTREYAKAVWREFQGHAGVERPFDLMAPREFDLVREWIDSGVPLRIVLRGIQDCAGKGQTLSYYAPAVKDAITYWRKAVPA
jgi:hypothetical protein